MQKHPRISTTQCRKDVPFASVPKQFHDFQGMFAQQKIVQGEDENGEGHGGGREHYCRAPSSTHKMFQPRLVLLNSSWGFVPQAFRVSGECHSSHDAPETSYGARTLAASKFFRVRDCQLKHGGDRAFREFFCTTLEGPRQRVIEICISNNLPELFRAFNFQLGLSTSVTGRRAALVSITGLSMTQSF